MAEILGRRDYITTGVDSEMVVFNCFTTLFVFVVLLPLPNYIIMFVYIYIIHVECVFVAEKSQIV